MPGADVSPPPSSWRDRGLAIHLSGLPARPPRQASRRRRTRGGLPLKRPLEPLQRQVNATAWTIAWGCAPFGAAVSGALAEVTSSRAAVGWCSPLRDMVAIQPDSTQEQPREADAASRTGIHTEAEAHMTNLLIGGDWAGAFELLAPLYGADYRLTLAPDSRLCDCPLPQLPALIVLAVGAGLPVPPAANGHDGRAIPWLCWNRRDDPASALAAYTAGALAVLPASTDGAVLLGSVRNALATVAPPPQTGVVGRRYAREELILLDRDAVLEVRSGVIAQAVIHPDGTAVLLGLCGPGQLLVGHPDDSCCLHLVAHTDATVVVRDWSTAAAQPGFSGRLRARLRQMEAWSAAQARHYLDQRVLGLLGLLAEEFGTPRDEGILIDVRITHAQLAAAVGATRTTITRILGELRARGALTTIGTDAGERFCLRTWERADHGLR